MRDRVCLIGCLADFVPWFVPLFVCLFVCLLVGWLVGWLVGRHIDCFVELACVCREDGNPGQIQQVPLDDIETLLADVEHNPQLENHSWSDDDDEVNISSPPP